MIFEVFIKMEEFVCMGVNSCRKSISLENELSNVNKIRRDWDE